MSRFYVSLLGGHGYVEYTRPNSIFKALLISVAPPILAIPLVVVLVWVYPHCPLWMPERISPYLPMGAAESGAFVLAWFAELLRWLMAGMFLYTSLPSDLDTRFNRGYGWWRRLLVLPLWLLFRLFYLFTRSRTLGYAYVLIMLVLIRLLPEFGSEIMLWVQDVWTRLSA